MLARLDYGDQLLVTVSTLIAYSKPVSSVQLMYPFYRCTNYPTVCDITIFSHFDFSQLHSYFELSGEMKT